MPDQIRPEEVPPGTSDLSRFRSFLAARWAADDRYDEGSWPALGSMPYRALVDAARELVRRTTVSRFRDLVPAGHADDPTLRLPELVEVPAGSGQAAFPAVELIWSYWLEEGMLLDTLDAVVARFENLRRPGPDPLARFDLTPLLPLRNRLLGYAADEVHRTTVRRRSAEYEHEYGFSLIGRAVTGPGATGQPDGNRFVETFHRVLFLGLRHLRELDDLTLQAGAFGLHLALRDCHLVLAERAIDRSGDVAAMARAEHLVVQSLLAEPQVRDFLGGRSITPHPEPWWDRVDSMKRIQGWTDTGVVHFHDLATSGERLVLTIRLGSWADPAVGEQEAAGWARTFRADIHRYAAAYRAATGVDLTQGDDAELPSTLLARRR